MLNSKKDYMVYGKGDVIILLHGLFGELSNFEEVISHFSKAYKVIIPILPLYSSSLSNSTIHGLVTFLVKLINELNLRKIHLVGNSLGGHIGLLYALNEQPKVATLTLTGSSGLFENSMGDGYPKKEDYEYVRKKTAATFYNPNIATKKLVDHVYEIVNNKYKAIRVISIAKSAMRSNLSTQLKKIKIPVNLIWGKNDPITPINVAEEFSKLLSNSTLQIIDKCGHAPMMEHPNEFNKILEHFLSLHPINKS